VSGFKNIVLSDWLELTKLRIVTMVLVTTALGWFLGRADGSSWWGLAATLAATGLAAGGSAVLNNYLERELDRLMERTRHRALPRGAIQPAAALAYGVLLTLGGTLLAVAAVNLLTGFLLLLTAFLYVLVYTPLKRVTWLNTSIGAIPGALPPVIGWAAAAGGLGAGAWVLFAILFAWQHPHFYAIGWLYREDYRAAGIRILPVIDPTGARAFRHAIGYALLLIVVSLGLRHLHLAGNVYLLGAVLAGAGLLTFCLGLAERRTTADARRVLLASVIYLPVLLALIVLDAGLARLLH
jgi:heme o synthase